MAVTLFQSAAFISAGPKDAVLSLLANWHAFLLHAAFIRCSSDASERYVILEQPSAAMYCNAKILSFS